MKEDPKVDKYTEGVNPQGGGGGEIDPKLAKQLDMFKDVVMTVLHGKGSRGDVVEMLKSGGDDPFTSFPTTAVAVNDMAVNLMQDKGVKVSLSVQLGVSQFLISDLVHLGYAAAGWQELREEEIKSLYEDTVQIVISRGLNDGSIDPIQLQLEGQDMMTEDQRRAGDMMAKDGGIPAEASQQVMTEQYANSKVRSSEDKMMQKASHQAGQQQAMQGPPQGQQGQGQQQQQQGGGQ